MASTRGGYIQPLPSGSFRVSVYAGTDPLTGRQIRLRRTCKTERAAQIALGQLLEQAAAGRQPETNATVAELLDRYAQVADWELSTREANEGYIRRTIKPAVGHLPIRKVRGPVLDLLYARLRRCSDVSCTGKPFTEHSRMPVLIADPADSRPAWEQAAGRLRDAIGSGALAPGDPLPSVRELNDAPGRTHGDAAACPHRPGRRGADRPPAGPYRGGSGRSGRRRRPRPGEAAGPGSRLQAGRLPPARVQADAGQDDPEHPQHPVRRLRHGQTLGLDRLESGGVGQAAGCLAAAAARHHARGCCDGDRRGP